MIRRHCTTDYKIVPIRRKVRELLGIAGRRSPTSPVIEQWIGISLDEAIRMKPSFEDWQINRWPLIEGGMTRPDCLRWLKRHGYPQPPKSACIGCPFHADDHWRHMRDHDPEAWGDAVSVDRAIRTGFRGIRAEVYLHRSFLLYSLIELAKAGSIVDYYDPFASQLPFDRISDVQQEGAWAKGAVFSYRLALNLLLLAALKRLLDIAQRRAEGADLRHIQELLRNTDVDARPLIEQLKGFALKGRGNAQLLLERILTPRKSDEWALGPDVRHTAANALAQYADRRGGTGALYSAIAAYRRILAEDWRREVNPIGWATVQNSFAIALQKLGEREGSRARIERAWVI
jgi:hypothetical protein